MEPAPPPNAFDPPDGWAPFDLPDGPSFVHGDAGDRFRVRYHHRGTELRAAVWFGPGTAGLGGHVHGGAIAAVLDEALGIAAWAAGYPVVAARLVTDFREMLPIGTTCVVETAVEWAEGRKVRVKGQLLGEDGTAYAEAESLLLNPSATG